MTHITLQSSGALSHPINRELDYPHISSAALLRASQGQFCSCDALRSIILSRLTLTGRISVKCHQDADNTCHSLLSSRWAGRASEVYRGRVVCLMNLENQINHSATSLVASLQHVSHL